MIMVLNDGLITNESKTEFILFATHHMSLLVKFNIETILQNNQKKSCRFNILCVNKSNRQILTFGILSESKLYSVQGNGM